MTWSEALAVASISFGIGASLGFAAGVARIREAVRLHSRRPRYRRVGRPE